MYRGSMCSNMILSYHLNPLCMNLLFLTHKFLIFLLDSHWLEVVQTWSRLSFKFRHRHDPLAVCIKSTEEAIWLPQYIPCLKVFREPWTSGFKTISKNGHLWVWYVSKPIAVFWKLNVSIIDCLFVSCEVGFRHWTYLGHYHLYRGHKLDQQSPQTKLASLRRPSFLLQWHLWIETTLFFISLP